MRPMFLFYSSEDKAEDQSHERNDVSDSAFHVLWIDLNKLFSRKCFVTVFFSFISWYFLYISFSFIINFPSLTSACPRPSLGECMLHGKVNFVSYCLLTDCVILRQKNLKSLYSTLNLTNRGEDFS